MAFSKKTWYNKPSTSTPINAAGLNDLENRIYNSDNALQTTINNLPQAKEINACDFNNLYTEKNGLFIAYAPCKNPPVVADNNSPSTHWYVIQLYHNSNFCIQIAFKMFVDDNIYIRKRTNGEWQNWNKFIPAS